MDDIPQELQTRIKCMLNDSGKIKKFQEEIKDGMKVAIRHIQSNENSKIINNPFEVAEENEIGALQLVIDFLQKNCLTYTLSTLQLEARVSINNESAFDLKEIIKFSSKSSKHDDKKFDPHPQITFKVQNHSIKGKSISNENAVTKNVISKSSSKRSDNSNIFQENQISKTTDEFEEIPDDYTAQGNEISKEIFEENDIIESFSSL